MFKKHLTGKIEPDITHVSPDGETPMARTLTEFPTEDRPDSPVDLSSYSEEELMAVVEDAFDRLSLENLAEMAVLLKERQENMAESARSTLLKEFEERASKMGLSLAILFPGMSGGSRRRRGSADIPVKYKDDKGNTWSGRGRRARWLEDAIAAGHSLDEFKVD